MPAAIARPDQIRQVAPFLPAFYPVRKLRQDKLSLPPYASISLAEPKNLLRHDREPNAAKHYQGLGMLADGVHHLGKPADKRLAACEGAVICVAQRDADQVKARPFKEAGYGSVPIIDPAKVKDFDVMSCCALCLSDIFQTDGRYRRLYPVRIH
jgi:hypothetical protein